MAISQGQVQAGRACMKGHLVRRGKVGAEQGSNFRILMEPWVYDNGILFPQIRDEQQLCGWIAETSPRSSHRVAAQGPSCDRRSRTHRRG
uniref:Uncharacterized protein n=1 Tax=Trichuris muris TaxID=70415 RepID=A0A5S6QNR7_TRIMR